MLLLATRTPLATHLQPSTTHADGGKRSALRLRPPSMSAFSNSDVHSHGAHQQSQSAHLALMSGAASSSTNESRSKRSVTASPISRPFADPLRACPHLRSFSRLVSRSRSCRLLLCCDFRKRSPMHQQDEDAAHANGNTAAASAAAAGGSASHAAASSNGATATAATSMHDDESDAQQPRSKMARLYAEFAHNHMDGPNGASSAASASPSQSAHPPSHSGSDDVANGVAAASGPLPAFTFASAPAPSVERVNLKRTGPSLVAVHDQQRPSKRLHRTKLSQIGDITATTGASAAAAGSLLTSQSHPSSHALQESNRLLAQAHEERVERRRRQQLQHLQSLAQSATMAPAANNEEQLTRTPERNSRRGDSDMMQSADVRPLTGFVFRASSSASAHSPALVSTPTRHNSDNSAMASPSATPMRLRSPAPSAAASAAAAVAETAGLQLFARPSSNRLPMSPLSRFHRSDRSSASASTHATSSFSTGMLSGLDALPPHVPWWQQQQAQPAQQPQRQTVVPSALDRSASSDGSWASTPLPSPPAASTTFFALQRPTFETSPWNPAATRSPTDDSSPGSSAARALLDPQLQQPPSATAPQRHSSGHMQD